MVTFMRSGSTFLGEMFNNHDDAFYVFEPLHPLSKLGFSKGGLQDRFEILTDNLNCNFKEQYVGFPHHFRFSRILCQMP